LKKKKSTTSAKDTTASTTSTSSGPYRNIEEAKKHQVSSFPDVKKVLLKPEHDFIIVACDGIWDCFTNE
jgi:serine/threonine protein phosphatase PrpC